MNAPDVLTPQMQRFIRAPREAVFDAFVQAEAIKTWKCPRGMTVPEARSAMRVGGEWSMSMRARDGTRFNVGGVYRELRRPGRIAYTFRWEGGGPMPDVESLVEIDLVEKDGGTELRLTHRGFPAAAAREAHRHGWASSRNRLVDLLDPLGTAATLMLLGDARSTYTRTARMALIEKGLAYTLKTEGPHAPAIDAVHPFGRIPALIDGETALWETSALVRCLDESFGDAPLLVPGTIIGRARCEQWVSAVNGYLYDTMIRRFVLQYVFPRGEGGQPDRAVIDGALEETPAQLGALNAAYGEGDWLAGDALSMADLFVAPILAYVQAMPESAALLAAAPNVQRAQAAIRRRSSFKDTEPPRG